MKSRPFSDFPRNEQGLVDNFIGTAFDAVYAVYLNLAQILMVNDKTAQAIAASIAAAESAVIASAASQEAQAAANVVISAVADALTYRNQAMVAADSAADSAEVAAVIRDEMSSLSGRFLPSSTTHPTTRQDGSPLERGDRYFNTSTKTDYFFDVGVWLATNSVAALQAYKESLANTDDPVQGAARVGWDGETLSKALSYQKVLATFSELRTYTGVAQGFLIIHPIYGGRFVIDPEDSTTPDDNGMTIVIADSGKRAKRVGVNESNPLLFGAVNSDTVNSTSAVRAAAAYSNRTGCRLTFKGMTKICVQRDLNVILRVSVDWAGCVHYLTAGSTNTRMLYTIAEDEGIVERLVTVADQATLTIGAKRLVFTEDIGSGFLYLNSTREINSRILAGVVSKVYYRQPFSIDRDGILNQALENDFTTGTQHTFTFKPYSDGGVIEVKNLVVLDASARDQGVLSVERSLTNVSNCSVQGKPGTLASSQIAGIFGVRLAAKVNLTNCYVGGRPATTVAQYGFTFSYVAECDVVDCSGWGLNTWGTMLSNYTNGMRFINCRFQRFDAHEPLMNWDILGCESYGAPIQYGSMYGYLNVNDFVMHNHWCLLRARNDYGGHCAGTIRVNNVEWLLRGYAEDTLALYEGPIGGVVHVIDLAYDIEFSNIKITHDYATSLTLYGLNTYSNSEIIAAKLTNLGFRKPKTVKFSNIWAVQNDFVFALTNIFVLGMKPLYGDGTTTWLFDRVMSRGYKSNAFFIANSTVASAYRPVDIIGKDDIYIENCPDVLCQLVKPGVTMHFNNIKPYFRGWSNWRTGGGAGGDTYINNCFLAGAVAIPAQNVGEGEYGTGTSGGIMAVTNSFISSTANLSAAKMLNGVVAKTGAAVTWPTGVSTDTALSGWKSSAFQ